MITFLCQFPPQLVFGAAALIGGGLYATYSIIVKKKQLGKKFVFEPVKIIDTVWQSVLTGIAAASAIGCSWYGILIAMVAAIGVDKIANKFKIDNKAIFNIIEMISKFLDSKRK
jgi:hypothetical protein